MAPSVRVLTVDDFDAWRDFVSSTLGRDLKFHIVGEGSDGLEAVHKAQQLQPELIVLDIGLPKLNGIEAARQIRRVAPNSKIVFLTENASPDVAAEALSTGASAYVVKSDAGRELRGAAEAAIRNDRFVSATLAGHDLLARTDVQNSVHSTTDAN